jgi:hypothetical protein
MWRGTSLIAKEGFSARRKYLNEFVQHHWVPDARLLGGIFTSIAQPISLEEFAAKKDWSTCHSIELIPELPGKRRMVWFLEARLKAAEAHAGLKQGRQLDAVPKSLVAPAAVSSPTAVPTPVEVDRSPRRVRALPVDRLPDVYTLIGDDGEVFGRGSVQQFSLSKLLREAAKGSEGASVMIEWNTEFAGYMITSLCPLSD